VIAADLPAALATLPPEWGGRLPGWTPERRSAVIRCIEEASGQRPIAPSDPLRALRFGSPESIKVVIFGQDPYPTAGHADGLAFSAGRGRPRSLQRVFEVLAADRPGFVPPSDWRLDGWARQGVLLLNPTLTVEVGRAGSHLHCGWHVLTSEIVRLLCARAEPPVFLLWGSQAQQFFAAARPPGANPQVLATRHPSYDFKRQFMTEGSHFAQTAHLVDWWGSLSG
jgi:uracil-DNA glycosylase